MQQVTLTAYGIAEPEVENAIVQKFNVHDRYFSNDNPTYVVTPKGSGITKVLFKKNFSELVIVLREFGYIPKLNREINRYTITILKLLPSSKPRYQRNLLLFFITVGTIFLDGFIRSNNPILIKVLMPNMPVVLNAFYFTIAILAIFGFHEFGHKMISNLRGIEASMPYFVPAPPGMGGTFGAIITQKEPPTNRDVLFDLGLSGPLIGFFITILITIIGLKLSFVVPMENVTEWMKLFPEVRFQSIPFPIMIEWLANFLKPTPEGMVLILHPVGFAAWVGCIVTFINLIPAWQLDGGHISRALLGKSNHRIMSAVGIILLLLSGYFIMAVVVAFFMMRTGIEAGGPLDDISPLSLSRKLFVLVYISILLLTLVSLFPL